MQRCRRSCRTERRALLPSARTTSDVVGSLRRTRHSRHLSCRPLPVPPPLHRYTPPASNLAVHLYGVHTLPPAHIAPVRYRILRSDCISVTYGLNDTLNSILQHRIYAAFLWARNLVVTRSEIRDFVITVRRRLICLQVVGVVHPGLSWFIM